MPHVSKRKLSEENFKNIYAKLVSIFDTAGKDRRSINLLKEFLTRTEKIMFAKRLAIIFMLAEGISIHYISQALLVSPSTVDRISLKFENGGFPYISNIIKKNKEDMWDILEKIIMAVPSRTGNARWKWFNEIDRRYKQKTFRT